MPPYFVFERSWVWTVMPNFLAASGAALPHDNSYSDSRCLWTL